MSTKILPLLALVALAPVFPAMAADEPAPAAASEAPAKPKVGQLLRDANGRRVAPIEGVQGNTVSVIMDMKLYHVPLSTLKMADKGWQTSLSRSEIR